jgi:hypothetical protein
MDDCFGVSFDSRGNMYATGRTWSPDYPVKNAFQMEYSNESADGIITKFNSKGKLDFSSYAGGSAWDTIHFVDADVNDNMITVGSGGPDGFPIRDAFQEEFGGGYDSVVMMLTTSGIPFFCSYLGGSGADHTWSLSQVSNKFLLTGETTSPDFPASADSFQQSLTGAEEGFIFRFDYASYFGAKGVDTNPNNTPGFSLLITSIGVSLLFIINSKKENR